MKDKKNKNKTNWYEAMLGNGGAGKARDKLKGRKKQLDDKIRKAGG